MANIGSLRDAIGETNKHASSGLTASTDLTATAETPSSEADRFFHYLRADSIWTTGGAPAARAFSVAVESKRGSRFLI